MATPLPEVFSIEARGPRVAARGELDLSVSDDLFQALLEACRAGSDVEVDLTGVSFIDSAGIHTLLRALAVLPHDCRLILVIPAAGPVSRVLDILGVERVPRVEIRRIG